MRLRDEDKELLNYDPMQEHLDELEQEKKAKEQEADVEANSNSALGIPQKKKKSLLLAFVPQPFRFMLQLFLKKKASILGKLLAFFIAFVALLLLLSTLLPTFIVKNIEHKAKKVVTKQLKTTKNKNRNINFEDYLTNPQTPADFSGGGRELDYDKLKELEKTYPQATAKAQRYQLYTQLGKQFGCSPLAIYGVNFVETTCWLGDINDIYQNMVLTDVGRDCTGPFQISSQAKHLTFAFESQHSTRQGSPKDNSIIELQGKNAGLSYRDAIKRDALPQGKLPDIIHKVPYDLGENPAGTNPTEMSWIQNINLIDSIAFSSRTLTKGTSKTYNNTSLSQYRHRPSPYYLPDASFSQAYDICWIKTQLDEAVNALSKGEKGWLSNHSNARELKWNDKYVQRYLSLNESQRFEIAMLYYCDWYLGSLTASESYRNAWQQIGYYGMDIINEYGSICVKRSLNTHDLWELTDGRDHSSKALLSNGKSLLERYGYYTIYSQIGGGGGGSKRWEAFTYGVRGFNGGYSIYLQDKEIYEKALKEVYVPDEEGFVGNDFNVKSGLFSGMKTAYPTESNLKTISSGYGFRKIDKNGTQQLEFHPGVDISSKGTGSGVNKVYAFADGEVIQSYTSASAGEYVVIKHSNGVLSKYMHMHTGSRRVKVGDKVKVGQWIGMIGNTGQSFGAHLHFQLQTGAWSGNTETINPLIFLRKLNGNRDLTFTDNHEPNVMKLSNNCQLSQPIDGMNLIAQAIVQEGISWVGVGKYVYGGKHLPEGIDCSNFVNWCYRYGGRVNYDYMATSQLILKFGKIVDNRKNLQPGDLLINANSKSHHVVMYAGNGYIVHAASTKSGLKYEKPSQKYLDSFQVVRRALVWK